MYLREQFASETCWWKNREQSYYRKLLAKTSSKSDFRLRLAWGLNPVDTRCVQVHHKSPLVLELWKLHKFNHKNRNSQATLDSESSFHTNQQWKGKESVSWIWMVDNVAVLRPSLLTVKCCVRSQYMLYHIVFQINLSQPKYKPYLYYICVQLFCYFSSNFYLLFILMLNNHSNLTMSTILTRGRLLRPNLSVSSETKCCFLFISCCFLFIYVS